MPAIALFPHEDIPLYRALLMFHGFVEASSRGGGEARRDLLRCTRQAIARFARAADDGGTPASVHLESAKRALSRSVVCLDILIAEERISIEVYDSARREVICLLNWIVATASRPHHDWAGVPSPMQSVAEGEPASVQAVTAVLARIRRLAESMRDLRNGPAAPIHLAVSS